MSASLIEHFDLLATAPGGVARLRELILTLAVQGKLVPQDPSDEPASVLLRKIRAEKDRLIAEGKIKRDKPLAPIEDEEKPFGLPAGWAWVRIPGITHSLGQGEPVEPFSYIDVAAIDNARGIIAPDVQVIQPADAPSRARKSVEIGTVLYSTVRPYLKNIAVVEKAYHPKPIVSTAFAVMHPHTGIHSKYLLHYLRSQPFTDFVNSKAVGVAYPAINDANFFQGVVPLPPAAEQSRIVARVEELMRLCDALEAKGKLDAAQHAQLVRTLLGTLTDSASPAELAANWQRVAEHFDLLLDRPEAVDALEQTILQLAVRGLLVPQDPSDEPASVLLQKIRAEKDRLIAAGKIKRDKLLAPIADEEKPFELPVGWEWAPVQALAHVGTGTTPSRDNAAYFSDTGIPWVTSGETGQSLIKKTDQFVTARALSETSLTLYPVGTLIVAMYGQGKTRGQVAELRIEAATNQACAAIVLVESSDHHRQFVKLVFEKSYDEIRNLAAGGAQPNLNVGKVKQTLISLPPLAEQSRIIARVEQLRQLCAGLRQRLTASRATQGQLAEALVAGC
jgi:type I restriction enzyme S subunit